ncbi:MAG: hypothetical protein KF705_00500 [Phycisphaeraceae bacterium]|nr:hypothetical protein [Phycisphaeraceae bacterium]
MTDVPQVDRDALVRRLTDAQAEREGTERLDPCRASIGEARVLLDMHAANMNGAIRAMRLSVGGKGTGRPRERWHVTDYPNRIDANTIRRHAKASGIDLRTLDGATIDVRPADTPDDPGERIALAVVADTRCGWRLWLLCPRCRCRRVFLYPTRAGIRCRVCAGIRYGGTDAPRY